MSQYPDFFDPARSGDLFQLDYHGIQEKALQWRKQYQIPAAATDGKKVALMIIDNQGSFCAKGSVYNGELFVEGSVDDTTRLCQFIYDNLNVLSKIVATLDTHSLMQIFHSIFFVNEHGEHPTPGTLITLSDIEQGKWKANSAVAASITKGNYPWLAKHIRHYAEELKKTDKDSLVVWPYHVMFGGLGHVLMSNLEQALTFHTIARSSQWVPQVKGINPFTENYSVFVPEVTTTENPNPKIGVHAIAQRNVEFLKFLTHYDRVIIAGQAKSHCVAWTISDLLNEIEKSDPEMSRKVYILEDCTSPVVIPGILDFTDEANQKFEEFKRRGVNIVKSTDDIHTWPNF